MQRRKRPHQGDDVNQNYPAAEYDPGLLETNDLLPVNFQPSSWDVICQRGRENFNHAGNQNFREVIWANLEEYGKAKTKLEKSKIVSEIVGQIRRHAGVGGFVKKDLLSGRWFEVGDKLAREKVGQALRDGIKSLEEETYQRTDVAKGSWLSGGKSDTSVKKGIDQLSVASHSRPAKIPKVEFSRRNPINTNMFPVTGYGEGAFSSVSLQDGVLNPALEPRLLNSGVSVATEQQTRVTNYPYDSSEPDRYLLPPLPSPFSNDSSRTIQRASLQTMDMMAATSREDLISKIQASLGSEAFLPKDAPLSEEKFTSLMEEKNDSLNPRVMNVSNNFDQTLQELRTILSNQQANNDQLTRLSEPPWTEADLTPNPVEYPTALRNETEDSPSESDVFFDFP